MKIVVIDGQGGGMGKHIIERLRKTFKEVDIIAIGTNSIATSSMIKAGADFGATGENPVVVNSRDADIIIGPIGIVMANALLGEVTPVMACAVGDSRAKKILVPMNKCNSYVVGVPELGLLDYVDLVEQKVRELLG